MVLLQDKLEKIFTANDKIELNDLTDVGLDKVNAYLALLFLTRDTDISLVQETIYGELYVENAKQGETVKESTEETTQKESEQTVAENQKSTTKDVGNFVAYELQGGMHNNVVKTVTPVKEAVIAS
jgi:hypothetical protein